MTLYQFKILSRDKQYQNLWERGTHLASRVQGNIKINLYGINSFYIEIYYHKDTKEFLSIETFKSVRRLEPYLQSIDLKELLSI